MPENKTAAFYCIEQNFNCSVSLDANIDIVLRVNGSLYLIVPNSYDILYFILQKKKTDIFPHVFRKNGDLSF